MGGQVIGSRENLATNSTSVWLDTRMETHMAGQHIRACKASTTNVAQIGLGSRVCRAGLVAGSHVFCQSVMEAEHLSTDWTNIGYLVTGRVGSTSA